MKKARLIALVMAGSMLLTGCSFGKQNKDEWNLPENPQNIVGEENDSSSVCYEVNGRKYSMFGTLKDTFEDGSIRECFGYLDGDRNTRVYALCDDPGDNYLMVCNVVGIMEQPSFFRALDTYNKNVFTPSYIESLGYEEWGSSGLHYEMATTKINLICNAENVVLIDYEFDINGAPGGGGQTGYLSGDEIEKGGLFTIEILELHTDGKTDKDKPFDVAFRFTVTDTDGNVHEVKGVYERTVMLGSTLNSLEIRRNNEGYYIFEDV